MVEDWPTWAVVTSDIPLLGEKWLTRAGDFSQGLTLISIIGYIIGHLSLLKADSFSIYSVKTHVSSFPGCKIICYYLNCYEKGESKRVQEDEVTFKSTGKGDRIGHIGGQENKSFFSGDTQKDRSLFSCSQETKSLLRGMWRNTSRDSWRVSGDIDSRLSPRHTVSINSECRWRGYVRVKNTRLLPGCSSGRKAVHAGELPSEDKKWWFGVENVGSFKKCVDILSWFFFHTEVESRSIVVHGCHLRMRLCGIDIILSG